MDIDERKANVKRCSKVSLSKTVHGRKINIAWNTIDGTYHRAVKKGDSNPALIEEAIGTSEQCGMFLFYEHQDELMSSSFFGDYWYCGFARGALHFSPTTNNNQ
jgi:hypothetical protein